MALSSRALLLSLTLALALGGGSLYGLSSCGGDNGGGGGDDASVDNDAQPMPEGGATCDANLKTDPHHCGSCTVSCSAGQVCNDGGCSAECTPPQVKCQGAMGCIDLTKDLNHCGDCNRVCSAPEGGIPVPDGGAPDAAGDGGDDGGPTDDGQRIATAVCDMGKCDFTCPQAPNVAKCEADAGGSPGCFDLTISPSNCGRCGNACPGACQQGICCDTPSLVCGGVCTDVTMDPNNCGACGNLCNVSGESCKVNDAGAPQCLCAPGKSACNGKCIDVLTDPNNCGQCGKQCHNGQQCLAGGCGGYTLTSPSPQPFVDACSLGGATTVLQNQSFAATGVLSLPFTLQYWGSAATQFWINTAGTVGLDGVPNPGNFPGEFGSCPNAIPDQFKFFTGSALGLFGDQNLQTGAKGICYATQGSMPNRQFVVTWEDSLIPLEANSDMTFSAILSETTNTIDFVYSKMNGSVESQGSSAIIGLQSPGGLAGVTKWCQQQFAATVPQSVRFTPIP